MVRQVGFIWALAILTVKCTGASWTLVIPCVKIRDGVISDEKYKWSPRITDKGRPNNFGIWLPMTKRGKEEINGNLIESIYAKSLYKQKK